MQVLPTLLPTKWLDDCMGTQYKFGWLWRCTNHWTHFCCLASPLHYLYLRTSQLHCIAWKANYSALWLLVFAFI